MFKFKKILAMAVALATVSAFTAGVGAEEANETVSAEVTIVSDADLTGEPAADTVEIGETDSSLLEVDANNSEIDESFVTAYDDAGVAHIVPAGTILGVVRDANGYIVREARAVEEKYHTYTSIPAGGSFTSYKYQFSSGRSVGMGFYPSGYSTSVHTDKGKQVTVSGYASADSSGGNSTNFGNKSCSTDSTAYVSENMNYVGVQTTSTAQRPYFHMVVKNNSSTSLRTC
ncbi:hypothetical protein FACS1894120_5000 [Clostridia bacterium]|nr:hypothetical protein FACS1894120_5000 [Clostridia bacterium]